MTKEEFYKKMAAGNFDGGFSTGPHTVHTGSWLVCDNAEVYAYDNATVSACDKAEVYAYDKAKVDAYKNTKVYAHDKAKVRDKR